MNSDDHGHGAADDIVFRLEPFPGLGQLEHLWCSLEKRAAVPFCLSWQWIGTMLAASGIEPVVLAGRRGDAIVLLALLNRSESWRHGVLLSRRLHLNETGDPDKDIIAIEYNGFLHDACVGRDIQERALSFLMTVPDDDPLLGTWDELRLGGVPVKLERLAAEHGIRRHTISRRGTAVVDLAAVRESGRDYLDSLGRNTRQQIRRAIRLYEERGPIEIEIAATRERAAEFLDGLKHLHQRHWQARGEPGAFGYPFLVEFHRQLFARCRPGDDYELVRVRSGDDPIGFIYNFRRDNWAGYYLGGFSYETDNRIKPGLVCFALYLQRQIEAGLDSYDFLAGDQRYKRNLGTPEPGLVWTDLQRSRAKLKLEDAVRAARRLWHKDET